MPIVAQGVQLTKEKFGQVVGYYWKSASKTAVNVMIGLVLLAMGIGYAFVPVSGWDIPAGVCIGLALFMILQAILAPGHNKRLQMRFADTGQMRGAFVPADAEFDERGLTWRFMDGRLSHYPWSAMFSTLHQPDGMVLFTSNGGFFWLPKSSIPSPEDWRQLEEWAPKAELESFTQSKS